MEPNELECDVVLLVRETHLFGHRKMGMEGPLFAGNEIPVEDPKASQHDLGRVGIVPNPVRIDDVQPMPAAKVQVPVSALEGTPVFKIVTLQPVACVIVPEGAFLGIEAGKARCRGDPELAVAVFQTANDRRNLI